MTTPATESTRRLLLASTAIANRVREAQSDFMLGADEMMAALGIAAGELVAEQAAQAGILSLAMQYEEKFIGSFREAFRARVGVLGIGRGRVTEAYPLAWPEGWARTPDWKREATSRFQVTMDKARRDLNAELAKMGASNVVISSWLAIRRDGQPYADQARRRITDPGVAVYFTHRHKQMVMARDEYVTVLDNLRSIGLAVQHLRGLERHGGAVMMERAFSGFAALPAPDRPDFRMVLGSVATLDEAEASYRAKAKHRHPDIQGGSEAKIAELNAAISEARKVLK